MILRISLRFVFVAGSMQECFSNGELDIITRVPLLFMPRKVEIHNKATEIMDWFADNSQPLKRTTVMVDEAAITGDLQATDVRFHRSRESDSLS
jgi:hypothetical protein